MFPSKKAYLKAAIPVGNECKKLAGVTVVASCAWLLTLSYFYEGLSSFVPISILENKNLRISLGLIVSMLPVVISFFLIWKKTKNIIANAGLVCGNCQRYLLVSIIDAANQNNIQNGCKFCSKRIWKDHE